MLLVVPRAEPNRDLVARGFQGIRRPAVCPACRLDRDRREVVDGQDPVVLSVVDGPVQQVVAQARAVANDVGDSSLFAIDLTGERLRAGRDRPGQPEPPAGQLVSLVDRFAVAACDLVLAAGATFPSDCAFEDDRVVILDPQGLAVSHDLRGCVGRRLCLCRETPSPERQQRQNGQTQPSTLGSTDSRDLDAPQTGTRHLTERGVPTRPRPPQRSAQCSGREGRRQERFPARRQGMTWPGCAKGGMVAGSISSGMDLYWHVGALA